VPVITLQMDKFVNVIKHLFSKHARVEINFSRSIFITILKVTDSNDVIICTCTSIPRKV
jgi:hypothetical protein